MLAANVNRSAFAGRNVRSQSARQSVVTLVKPSKAADFRSLTNEQLFDKVFEAKTQLATTRFIQKTRGINLDPSVKEQQQPDPEKIPKTTTNKLYRREIAQCLTILRQRQIEDGIDRDASKKLFRKFTVAAGMGGLGN